MAGALRFTPFPSIVITLLVDESSGPGRAYKGFVASSQRHGGVYSTLDAKYQVPQPLSDEHTSLSRNKTLRRAKAGLYLELANRVSYFDGLFFICSPWLVHYQPLSPPSS